MGDRRGFVKRREPESLLVREVPVAVSGEHDLAPPISIAEIRAFAPVVVWCRGVDRLSGSHDFSLAGAARGIAPYSSRRPSVARSSPSPAWAAQRGPTGREHRAAARCDSRAESASAVHTGIRFSGGRSLAVAEPR